MELFALYDIAVLATQLKEIQDGSYLSVLKHERNLLYYGNI
jgi:hypothetical protein